jgi:hypothetical protein
MPDEVVHAQQVVLSAFAVWGAVVTLLLAACGADAASPAPLVPSVHGAVPRPDHVLVVVFENKDYEQIVGSPQAPYLTALQRWRRPAAPGSRGPRVGHRRLVEASERTCRQCARAPMSDP